MASQRKTGAAVLKIAFSALLLYFVFRQIPFKQVWEALKTSSWGYLLPALGLFIFSKWLAALRLNRYFHAIDIPLSTVSNLKLYLLGMFYNLFLPGGIGGDAYKGFLLKRRFARPTKRIAGVLLLDRVSGLFALFTYSVVLLYALNPGALADFRWVWPMGILAGLGAYYFFHQKLFPYVRRVFWPAMGFSALVQLAQLGAAGFILMALNVEGGLFPYLLLFLLSSMAAVLPLTIGGVGSREVVFLYGSRWWALEEPVALALSLLFFGITAAVSLCGVAIHFGKRDLIAEVGTKAPSGEDPD
mgnify:CR=1 FL=1